ncbi:MAG: phosphatase PAP2 family protein [Solirubrobacteraceae bacterium]
MTLGSPPSRFIALVAALAVLILAGIGLHLLSTLAGGDDLSLVRDLARERTDWLTTLAHGFSLLGRSIVLLPGAIAVALALAFVFVASGRDRDMQGLAIVTGIIGAMIIQNVDKAIVGRPRPPVVQLEHVTGTSFPSGHATEATAFWLVLLIVIRLGRWPRPLKRCATPAVGAIVVGVALSRVYLGVHYPTDVISGALLGGAWALTIAAVLLPGDATHGHGRCRIGSARSGD